MVRECLIDGNVQGDSLAEFLSNRQQFLQTAFGSSKEEFKQKVAHEIDRILQIPPAGEAHLWFEEDLFCQTNFWFTAHLLHTYTSVSNIYLVLPSSTFRYGFGGMNQEELVTAYQNKYLLQPPQIKGLQQLWLSYQQKQTDNMLKMAKKISPPLPFLIPAIQAHINRLPDANGLGYPERLILTIQQELHTQDFPIVFKEFSKRAAIYGFGDLQVRRIWEQVNGANC